MTTRGVRGAVTVAFNDAEEILRATRELLEAVCVANPIVSQDIAAALFTTTDDLDAAFPATAARELGWTSVPLLGAREVAVPGSLPRCIRLLLLWNTEIPQSEIVHVYLREARRLRSDLARTADMEESQ